MSRPERPPNTGKIHFLAFLVRIGPQNGPADPLKSANREMRPQEAEPSEVTVVQKLPNANAVPMSQKFPTIGRWRRVTAKIKGLGGGGGGVKQLHLPPAKT